MLLPRFHHETVALCPENILLIFFGKKASYKRRGPRRPAVGSTSLGGAPHLRLWLSGGVPPRDSSFSIFINSKINLRKILDHLELQRIVISVVALFRPRIQAAGDFPLHRNLAQ